MGASRALRVLLFRGSPLPNPRFSATRRNPHPTSFPLRVKTLAPISNPDQNPHSPSPPNPSSLRSRFLRPSPFSAQIRHPNFSRRLLSTSAKTSGSREPEDLGDVVELIKRDSGDLESELDRKNLRISRSLVAKVLRFLNDHGVSALRFFNWVLNSPVGFRPNGEIYNQVVDNLGRLDDYRNMAMLLNELSPKGHCLTEKAFGFVTVCGSLRLKDLVREVVRVLNGVGGSCRGSGIYSLTKVLCAMSAFDVAVFVVEETGKRASYYNVLIAAKCRSGDFQGARDVLDEMRRVGCDLTTKSYNYLLGSLFKRKRVAEACSLMQNMEELGYHPDTITFEVVALHACKAHRMDLAMEVLSRMLHEGLNPRFTMHAAFIKGYCWSGQIERAYKYVVDMSVRDKCSSNMNYSLLARLFLVSGRVAEAGRVLQDMMDMGLKPNFPVYVRVTKDLYKMGRGDLASELKTMFLRFNTSLTAA